MTDDERKAWIFFTDDIRNAKFLELGYCIDELDADAILAADSELKRLTEENGRMREAVEWACEDMRQNDVIPYDTKKRLINELRRRAGIGA